MSMTGVQLNASPGFGGGRPSPYTRFSAVPPAQGLYDPAAEKDACGLAMIASLKNSASHQIVSHALTALRRLEHRGAIGSDAGTGDGAGIITQIPDAFLRAVAGFELPAAGRYAVGMAFLPTDAAEREAQKAAIARIAEEESLRVLGWREVPTDPAHLGTLAREAALSVVFLAPQGGDLSLDYADLLEAHWVVTNEMLTEQGAREAEARSILDEKSGRSGEPRQWSSSMQKLRCQPRAVARRVPATSKPGFQISEP